jgi:pilus assembly protein CpaB
LLLNVYLRRRETEIWERMKQAQQKTQPAAVPEEIGVVLLAKSDIPPQTPITPEDLLIKEIPVKYIQPGAVTSLAEVIGQISNMPIVAGEQILRTKLLPPGKIGKSLSEITPKGKRAVTVTVDNISSISGLLKPGDYVDVSALLSPPLGSKWPEAKEEASRLVLLFQGVEVLAVGSEVVAPSSDSSGEEKARKISTGARTATLALDPQEAVLLSFVQEHSKIKLALRASEDVQTESIKPADWDSLFEYLYPSRGPDLEGKQAVVEIYRGLKREVIPLSEGEE